MNMTYHELRSMPTEVLRLWKRFRAGERKAASEQAEQRAREQRTKYV